MSVHFDLRHMGLTNSRATRRTLLKPALVEAALARLGEERFSRDVQSIILRSVSNPEQVSWPDWWEVLPSRRAPKG